MTGTFSSVADRRRRVSVRLPILVVVGIVLCCSEPTGPVPVPVASVTVSPAADTLSAGDSVHLLATIRDSLGRVMSGSSVVWSVDSPVVATVSASGLVRAKGSGSATITATSEGHTGTAKLVVRGPGPVAGLIVSAPLSVATAGPGATPAAPQDLELVTYVSMTPGTVPGAREARIWNRQTGQRTMVAVRDGGFDPIPLTGAAGDTILVTVTDSSGGVVSRLTVVPGSKPPVTIRTTPPAKKTDVPLNAVMFAYFSEPVDSQSAAPPGIQVYRGTTPVSGTIQFTNPVHTGVAFIPASPLDNGTSYRLVVSTQVRDLNGLTLSVPDSVDFTTDSSLVGPPASLTLGQNDSVFMVTPTYQLLATVRDAAGNELIGQPLTWTTSDPTGRALTVSPTGLLTAFAAGQFGVQVSSGALSAQTPVFVTAGPASSISMIPTTVSIPLGDTVDVSATVRDARGFRLNYPSVSWSSDSAGVATIQAAPNGDYYGTSVGTVTATGQGTATLIASSNGQDGSVAVIVGPPRVVASVRVSPRADSVLVHTTAQLTPIFRDSLGVPIPASVVTASWASDAPAVATVDGGGLVTAQGPGVAHVSVSSGGQADTASITVQVVQFASVAAGGGHACAQTTGGVTYCWGWNGYGQLGDNTLTNRSGPSLVAGGSLAPATVASGAAHTCGLDVGGLAYCWGDDNYGQLGDADWTDDLSTSPVPVSGGLAWATLSEGGEHTCGLTGGGAAYCWGSDTYGQLGDSGSFPEPQPVPVVGGLTFTAISAGLEHTCGLTAQGAVYCWGRNDSGQLGDSTLTNRSYPALVAGSVTFTAVKAGQSHTCALAVGGTVYCWGSNAQGAVGDGTTSDRLVPTAVAFPEAFSSLSAGSGHTCAITTAGTAFCWGWNNDGQLGDGSSGLNANRLTPSAVTGGLIFTSISSGSGFTCGMAGGAAYCWGADTEGQLGNVSSGSTAVPVKVAGQP